MHGKRKITIDIFWVTRYNKRVTLFHLEGDDCMVTYTEQEKQDLQTRTMIIYKIQNIVNGKVYIGKTKHTFNKRYHSSGIGAERVLKSYNYKGNGYNDHLKRSMEKYGTHNFKVSIIDYALTEEELNVKEIYYIQFYNARDSKFGYNNSKGGEICGCDKWDFYRYEKQNMLIGQDISLFEKLLDSGYDNDVLCDELFKKIVIVVKRSGDKNIYYYYDNVRYCAIDKTFKNDMHDIFIMCKRSQGCKEEWTKLKYLHGNVGTTKFYFSEDITLPKNTLFENAGEGLKIKNEEKRIKAKEAREKKLTRQRVQKHRTSQVGYSGVCKDCGKQIYGCQYCADCKAKRDHEKQKQKAIQQGRQIKNCPICGREHWKTNSETCGNSLCLKKFKEKKK